MIKFKMDVLLINGMVDWMWATTSSSCCWFHTNIVPNNNENIWFPYGNISIADYTFYLYCGLVGIPTSIDY
jgi:hypothetical protein